jgi:hypothetical protein
MLSTIVGLGLDMASDDTGAGPGGGSKRSGAAGSEEAMARSRICRCRFLRDTSQVDIRWKKPSGVASSILLRWKKR